MKSGEKINPRPGKRVVCPTCGGESVYEASNAFRPFCSERCKNIDFGAWASENFRMASDVPQDDQGTDNRSLQ